MSTQPTPPQNPVGILWDMESCPVPSNISTEEAADDIRTALRVHPQINGNVTLFSAFGDFKMFPQGTREGCEKTRVIYKEVPKGDSVDKAILLEMLSFAVSNRPPAYIMLISGDDYLSQALHVLREGGYTVILAIPSEVGVSSALRNAGSIVCDWPSLPKTSKCCLKRELVSLLESSLGGWISLDCLANEYQQTFKRPLVSDYNNQKLLNLLEEMSDEIEIKEEGQKKTVHCKKWLPIDRVYEVVQEILGSYYIGISVGCIFLIEENYQKQFKKPLPYKALGVQNLEELLYQMRDKGMVYLSGDPDIKRTYWMSAASVKNRQEAGLKLCVQHLLHNRREIPFHSFEDIYKDRFLLKLNYQFYGLTGLDHLCKVFNLVVEEKSGEKVIKNCQYNLRKRK